MTAAPSPAQTPRHGARCAFTALRGAFVAYSTCVLLVTLGTRLLDARVPVLGPVAVHAACLAIALLLPVDRPASRFSWSAFVLGGLPVLFTAVGLALPALHPQPFEWRCIAFDRWLFGTDPGVALQPSLTPVLVEVLQVAYACFYFLPVALLLTLLAMRRFAAYDQVLLAVGVGFLLSYLGYYLLPTLPPYRYLAYGPMQEGLAVAGDLHRLLDRLEFNRFDCMPSGHTMLTLLTLELARRHAPVVAAVLLPVGLAVIAATVALRYHYVVDLVAGALLVPPALRAARFLLTVPAAGPVPHTTR